MWGVESVTGLVFLFHFDRNMKRVWSEKWMSVINWWDFERHSRPSLGKIERSISCTREDHSVADHAGDERLIPFPSHLLPPPTFVIMRWPAASVCGIRWGTCKSWEERWRVVVGGWRRHADAGLRTREVRCGGCPKGSSATTTASERETTMVLQKHGGSLQAVGVEGDGGVDGWSGQAPCDQSRLWD